MGQVIPAVLKKNRPVFPAGAAAIAPLCRDSLITRLFLLSLLQVEAA